MNSLILIVKHIDDPLWRQSGTSCLRFGVCDQEFTYPFKKEPQFFGSVPQGAKLQQELLNFRKQSELNFALESNLLDGIFRHKKLPVRKIRTSGDIFEVS